MKWYIFNLCFFTITKSRQMFFRLRGLRSLFLWVVVCAITPTKAQDYPFILPNEVTATLNVSFSETETANNKLLGTNIA